jgi:hypothetical protein
MGGKGAPSLSFPTIKTRHVGVVVDKRQAQQTTPDGALKTFDNGDPMMQVIITLQTEVRDPAIDGDDGTRRLFAKGNMIAAIRDAVKEANPGDATAILNIGDQLAIEYTGDGEQKKRGFSPPKLYRAWVKKGVKLDDPDAPF